jgi:HPt (histidine-containing phosphotransfer) domain-containing protein
MSRRDLTGAVNFAYLEDYAGGDQGVVDEVLSMFREQAGLWARLLDPARPGEGWRDAAHTLKGAALGVGATALGEACAAAETVGDTDPTVRTLLLERVRDALDLALADIAAYAHEQALRALKTPSRG